MDQLGQVIFDDKTFSDLLKEIHVNQKKKCRKNFLVSLTPTKYNIKFKSFNSLNY